MTQMIVRPPQFYPDTLGNPADKWRVYVGKSNTDPKQPANQLVITDGIGGEVVSNPFIIHNGRAANLDGQYILPVIEGQEYSLRYESELGGEFFEYSRVTGDALGASGGGGTGGIPDAVFNNLQQPIAQDLSAYNFIYVKATASGWEGTANGADLSQFYYRDGTSGAPSTGDGSKFYDSLGNGWIRSPTEYDKVLAGDIAANTSAIAQNASDIATNASDISQNSSDISLIEGKSITGAVVGATGAISGDAATEGFTCIRSSTGLYQITPTLGWDAEIIVASQISEPSVGGLAVYYWLQSSGYYVVSTTNVGGSSADVDFKFIVFKQ